MKNILTIAKYELKRLSRDWRLVLMVLSQPIVIALIVGLISHHEPNHIKVLVQDMNKNEYSTYFIDQLQGDGTLDMGTTSDFSNEAIVAGSARVLIRIEVSQNLPYTAKVDVKTDPTGGMATIVAERKISEVSSNLAKKLAEANITAILSDRQKYVQSQLPEGAPKDLISFTINSQSYNPLTATSEAGTIKNTKYFDYLGSSMMVVLVMLVVLNLSGIAITGERVSGTFERMSVTPFRKKDIILGKAMALFLIGLAVNVIGIVSLKVIYSVTLGNFWLISLMAVLVVSMSVGLGLFVSSITKTVVESVELAMYVFFVSFLASGILMPVESSYKAFAWVENALPFYHAVDASRRINMLGAGWPEIANDAYIVTAYTVLFLILATVALRRKAK